MPTTCPECGAVLSEDISCQTIFESFLVLEYSDPDYGAVHMLTVACFMIQHGRYSNEGLAWIHDRLRENLEEGIPADQIRKRAAKETGQVTRTWKVNRRQDSPPLPTIAWSMTIADVASNDHDAGSYCECVKQWAHSTLHEMKPLLGSGKY